MGNHTHQHEWEHDLHQMQNLEESFYDMHDEFDKKIFQCLKWSYNALLDYLKPCFLYFTNYPEDREIMVEGVIDIWVVDGLIKGSGERYFPDPTHSFSNYLRDHYLIEVVSNDDLGRILYVKIHDVLRDLAIHITEE